jgi:hypothetical protein
MTNASYNQANVVQTNLELRYPNADIHLRSVERPELGEAIDAISGAGARVPTSSPKLKPQPPVKPVDPAVKLDVKKSQSDPYAQTYKKSVTETLPAKNLNQLYNIKKQLANPALATAEPAAAENPVPAKPAQPRVHAALTDLQRQRDKVQRLINLKQEIETLTARAGRTRYGITPGLAADIEDLYPNPQTETDMDAAIQGYEIQRKKLADYIARQRKIFPKEDVIEGQHQHTEIIKWPVGNWIVYLDNHSVIRAMTRNIGPRMMSNLLNMVSIIPNLEDKVPKNGAFWIQDIKTNSSFYFRRLDIPSEPLAVRCETGVQDVPRANKNTPVFRVNAYTGPETPKDIQGMKQAKLRSKFVGTNVMASNLATNIQKGHLGSNDVIRNPATQDSKRYDRAFKQAQQIDKEVDENFADGKKPGRKGLSKRVGIPKKTSLSKLQKIASSSTGERRRMAQWQLNMRRGKAKKNESEMDEGWKQNVAAGVLGAGMALGNGAAQADPDVFNKKFTPAEIQQIQTKADLTQRYYNELVRRAKEDGRIMDRTTLNMLKAQAEDAAARSVQQRPQAPQAKSALPGTQPSEIRRSKNYDNFESVKK